MDPPDHTRLRGLVSKAFTPRVVEELRPRAQQIVDRLLDAAVARGELDVIADLAYPLPVTIISEMLGVPQEDHEIFQGWSREMARSLDPDFALPPDVVERRQKASEEFADYFRVLIAKRRTDLRDDLVSALIAAEDGGETLSESELLSTCILLLIAGHETTVNLIGNGMLALLRNPDQVALLRDDPSLIKTAVEELLRFDPPVQLTGRTAKEDIALSEGVLPEGPAGDPPARRGESRSAPVRRPRPPRHHSRREPPPRVRHGHPLLPRRAARAHRRPDRHRRDGPPPAGARTRRRGAGVQGEHHPARLARCRCVLR